MNRENTSQSENFTSKISNALKGNHLSEHSESSINNDSNNRVWGEPLRIATSNLQRDDFVVTQDLNGSLHCIWKQKVTLSGISLYYSSSTDEAGINWSTPAQVTRLETTISQLALTCDAEGILHLFFISFTNHFYRIYYCYKDPMEAIWNEEVLITSSAYEFSSLTTCFTNETTLNIAWIVTNKTTNKSKGIYYQQKDNSVKKWLSSPLILFNTSNPEIMDLVGLENNLIGICWTNKTKNKIGNIIQYNQFDPQTLTLGNSEEIATTNELVGGLKSYFSKTEKSLHFFWRIDAFTTRIYYREKFRNGTLNPEPELISYAYSNCYIGGLAEDPLTGNIYFIYEDRTNGGTSALYLRKKLPEKVTWESNREKIMNNSNGRLPIFISNNQNNTIGQLFYHSYLSIVTTSFKANEQWLSSIMIYQTSFYDSEPSFDIDSVGTIHLVWKHRGINSQERILYQTKKFNESWGKISFINQTLDEQEKPKIIIDQNDRLHCVFVAETQITNYQGVFYTTKLLADSNWSSPILIKTPENYLDNLPAEILIDSNSSVHVFWSEQIDSYSNQLLHAFKDPSSENFTVQSIPSEEISNNIYPTAVIDNDGTIHLVYIKENIISEENEILYRYKPINQNWSQSTSLVTSATNYFEQPLVTCDSQNRLNLLYMKRVPVVGQLLASTVNHWQKEKDGNWTFKETLFELQLIDHHSSFTAVNDSIIYVYHMKYYIEGILKDKIAFKRFNKKTDSWEQEEIVFNNPNYDAIPIGAYDANNAQFYFILLNKLDSFPHLNWLTNQLDSDEDGLGDYDEQIFNTDPLMTDSDKDLLSDGLEVKNYITNPTDNDTDWDGLNDGSEILIHLTDPKNADSDEDQLIDGEEVAIWSTDPTSQDTDQDTLTDYQEIYLLETSPNTEDTDGDGMLDPFEIENDLKPTINDSQEDEDEDQLTNIEEYLNGTDPNNPDCDEDNLLDGEEVHIWNTNPLDLDSDGDTISDYDEVIIFQTNPNAQDSDNDNFSDREEINSGTDPNDPKDNDKRRRVKRILISIFAPTTTIIIIIICIEIWYRIREKRIREKEKEEIKQEEAKLEQLLAEKNKK